MIYVDCLALLVTNVWVRRTAERQQTTAISVSFLASAKRGGKEEIR